MLLIWAAIEITREIIYADSTLEESRFRPEYFTRNRLMPFYKLLRFLLSMYKTSSQTALNQFFEKEEVKKLKNPDLHTAPKQSIIKSLQIRSDVDEQSEQIKETNTVG